ncbi:hypothetical protein B0T18DRAFT_401089 [Schizothecium vesticola]|uniref:Uncharacterized protein n=1 Tax=Schizothecium vesticola TaxID=314040 RepID=A0AA40K9Y4_9PEZI|nr:hypothetical protein B0T18DRAFT_401089 [Schizothecium vesticola]
MRTIPNHTWGRYTVWGARRYCVSADPTSSPKRTSTSKTPSSPTAARTRFPTLKQPRKSTTTICAANGFTVPGHTYVRTRTVRVSTGQATAAVPTTGGPAAGGSGQNVPNAPPGATATVTVGGITATATVFRSLAGPQLQPLPWLQPFLLLVSVLVNVMLALADTVVVIVSESLPEAGGSSVYTTTMIHTTGVVVSTRIVTQPEIGGGQPSPEAGDPWNGSSSGNNKPAGGDEWGGWTLQVGHCGHCDWDCYGDYYDGCDGLGLYERNSNGSVSCISRLLSNDCIYIYSSRQLRQ